MKSTRSKTHMTSCIFYNENFQAHTLQFLFSFFLSLVPFITQDKIIKNKSFTPPRQNEKNSFFLLFLLSFFYEAQRHEAYHWI